MDTNGYIYKVFRVYFSWRRNMGYNYELNVEVETTQNVYLECAKHIVEEYPKEWGQHSDEKTELQYIYCHSSYGTIYLRRYEVMTLGKTEEKYFLSQNVNSLKSGESTNLFSMQQEIIDGKDNIVDFLREVGFDHSFQLLELQVSITEQESPYMK